MPALTDRMTLQETGTGESLFGRPAFLRWALIGLIFAVGLAVRLYNLGEPLLDFHPTRQVHSALIARGMYMQGRSDLPAWQRQMAVDQWHMEGLVEPQVFERLVAWTFDRVGGPDLRIPRLYAVLFWMVAAVFLTWLAFDLTGWGGALVAALFFLAWPYGVIASRAFQPEPLMMGLMAAALWTALRWQRRGGWRWAVAAGILAGLAIFIKTVAIFFIGPALIVLAVVRCGFRRVIRDPQSWVLAFLALLPSAIYYIDGVYLHHYLVGQFSMRFFPQMWLDPAFYLRWISNLGRVVPFEMTLAALIGAFLVQRPADRALLLAMWAGYLAYGLALPHHISTHDYYHLPLFVPLALGLAAIADTLFQNLRGPRWLARTAAAGILLAALVINGYAARTSIKRSGAEEQARALVEIGQVLGPGASAIALVDDYGVGLKYWSWINPALWPTGDEILWQESLGQKFNFDAFFNKQAASKNFFVIMQPGLLDSQSRLKDLLFSRYPVYRQAADYLIFDLRSPVSGQGSP